MRKTAIIFIIFMIANIIICNAKNNIPATRFLNLTNQELKELGINVTKDKVEFIEKRKTVVHTSAGITDKLNYRKVVISGRTINIKNAKKNELKNFKDFNPRLAVNSFSDGATAYFSEISDFKLWLEKKISDNQSSEQYLDFNNDVNGWVAIHIKQEDSKIKSKDIYLWYFPSDEFINNLPERYRTELKNDNNTSIDNSNYSNNNGSMDNVIFDVIVYPNPIQNRTATLSFKLESQRMVTVSMYDVNGNWVKNFSESQSYNQGLNTITFTLENIPSGMYMIALTTDRNEKVIQRIVVLN